MFRQKVLLGIIVLALLVFVGRQVAADAPKVNTSDKDSVEHAKIADRQMAQWREHMAALKAKMRKEIDAGVTGEDLRRAKIAADQQMAQWRERMAARKAKMRKEIDAGVTGEDLRRAKIAVGPNANATVSIDLIPDGGAGNQIDDGVTSGTVSGQGTKIAVEVFAKGVTTPLAGVTILFEFDASVLTLDKVENSAFAFAIPEATGTNLAATTPVALPQSGFIARAEFSTVTDVTHKAFNLTVSRVKLSESATSSDEITTTSAISFNALRSPDFDGDGTVGTSDFLLFVAKFGLSRGDAGYDAKYDLDSNGGIGISDFLIFTASFGQQVPPSNGGGTPATYKQTFDLYALNGNPSCITYANNRFYVPDSGDAKVYVYSSSGQRVASADFDLDSDNRHPGGITYTNNRFYVVDWIDEKVYVYSNSGQRVASADFDLDSDNRYPLGGITYANNRFYVLDGDDTFDWGDEKVYVYTSSGQRVASADFDLETGNGDPQGITYANNRFYVLDEEDEKVYVYTSSGQRVASAEFDLDGGRNIWSEGITYANNRFYVTDAGELSVDGDDKMLVYTSSGQRVASAEFDLHSENNWPSGITYANNRFYVTDYGYPAKVYVYTSSGQRVASAEFDLHSNNGAPTGITYANNRFYVLDEDDKVYVYE